MRNVVGWKHGASLMILAAGLLAGASAQAEEAEPTPEECTKAVTEAHDMASRLSAKSLSRYFAERYLHSAKTEAGNGEFDECVEYAARAVDEIEHRRHWLAPGETFRASTSTGHVELSGDDQ